MKNIVYKIIFIISFIPYLNLLFLLAFGGYILNGVQLTGIDRLSHIMISYLEYNLFLTPIIPACLTFQMCYIFKKHKKIMFICSFIPYIFILLLGLKSSFWGITLLQEKVYGIEGFILGIIMGFASNIQKLPIIPLSVVFQIVFITKNKKSITL